MRVLLTWIGAQDPWRPREGRRTGKLEQMPAKCPSDYADGPILTLISRTEPFDAIHLLYDPPKDATGALLALTDALKERVPGAAVVQHLVPVNDPRRYVELYRYIRATCEAVELAHPNASFHILLSPGTPQVHAIWVLLSKTVFPATTWQTSEFEGAASAEIAEIPFNLHAELIAPVCDRSLSSARLADVPGLIFRSEGMVRAVGEVAHIAKHSDVPLLLLGETGVGKERLARYAHSLSTRRQEPFVGVNCSALPSHLVESELFGHVRGAFTGADREKAGLFEAASSGTLFLDEIGELPLDVQAKLLRVLQERELRRVGGTKDIAVNPRIIAATHQDLATLVKEKRFREDLYYRIAVSPVRIPPLRERREDISLLAQHFLSERNKARRKRSAPMLSLTASGLRSLEAYAWPGNVRELENAMERVALFAKGPRLGVTELRELLPALADAPSEATPHLNDTLDALSRKLITEALARHGTQKEAARALGLGTDSALQSRMKTLGMRHIPSPRVPAKGRRS